MIASRILRTCVVVILYSLASIASLSRNDMSAVKEYLRKELVYRSKNITVNVLSHRLNNLETTPLDEHCSVYDDGLRKYRQFVIFIAISESYFSTFLNWLVYFDELCPNSSSYLYIECIDKSVNNLLKPFGLQCSNSEVGFGLSYIWLYRAKVISALLESYIDVLMSDSDAFWQRNPFPRIQEHISYASIISSRATYPSHVSRFIGATMCMGFIYIKADNSSQYVWNQFMKAITIRHEGDDQREFNRLLVSMNISYPIRPYILNSTVSNIGYLISRYHNLNTKVVLLPHEEFRRKCANNGQMTITRDQIKNSIVVHCLSSKNMSSKFNTAFQYGMWRITDSWNGSIGYDQVYGNRTALLKAITRKPQVNV